MNTRIGRIGRPAIAIAGFGGSRERAGYDERRRYA